MADTSTPPKTNPKAEEAFADYVAMGPSRSLPALAKMYQSDPKAAPTTRLRTLKDWSSRFHWQGRIATTVAARTEALLEEAAEYDADTYVRTSRKLNASITTTNDVQEIIRIRESVRKPKAAASASVAVNVSIELRQLVDQVAREDGLSDDEKQELIEAVERHLSEAVA